MTRQNSLRIVVIVAVLTTTVSVVGLGSSLVAGYPYNVGGVENIGIGPSENQVISDITVRSDSDPVSINVGELVDAGAKLDQNSSSYDITNGQSASTDEVKIINSNTSEATIIIEPSALEGFSTFDLVISGIDTTEVSLDPGSESTINSEIEYQIVQNGVTARSSFTLSSSSFVSIKSYDGYENLVKLTNVSLENETENHIVIWKLGKNGELNKPLGEVQGQQDNVTIEINNIKNDTQIAAAVHPGASTPDYETVYAINSTTIEVPIQLAVERTPIHYIPHENNLNYLNNSIVEIIFNSNISNSGEVVLEFENSQSEVIDLENSTNKYSIQNHRLLLYPSKFDLEYNKRILGDIQGITLNNIHSKNDDYPIKNNSYNVNFLSKTISNGSNVTVSKGDSLGFEIDELGPSQIQLSNESNEIYLKTDLPTQIIPYNSTELTEDSYFVSGSSFINETIISVEKQELIPKLERSVFWSNENIPVSAQSFPTNRAVSIELRNASNNLMAQESIFIDRSGIGNTSFDPQPSGNYTISVVDEYSQIKSLHTIRVVDPDPPGISVDSVEKSVGDVIEFDIIPSSYSNTTNITITESNSDEPIATASVTTPRAEPTTLRFNTYAAGDPELADDLFTIDGPGTIESATTSTVDGAISSGEYEITATATPNGPTDTATMTLRNRSMDDLSVYSTAETDAPAFSTSVTITDAIANGTLNSTETVTSDETVVYSLDATGLSGYTAVRDPTLSTGADLDRLAGLEFSISNATDAGTNATPVATANGTTVLTHETGLFLVGNASETLDETTETTAETDLVATFDVLDDRLRAAAGSKTSHVASTPFTYARNTTELDGTDGSDGTATSDVDSSSDGTGTTETTDGSGDGGTTDRTEETTDETTETTGNAESTETTQIDTSDEIDGVSSTSTTEDAPTEEGTTDDDVAGDDTTVDDPTVDDATDGATAVGDGGGNDPDSGGSNSIETNGGTDMDGTTDGTGTSVGTDAGEIDSGDGGGSGGSGGGGSGGSGGGSGGSDDGVHTGDGGTPSTPGEEPKPGSSPNADDGTGPSSDPDENPPGLDGSEDDLTGSESRSNAADDATNVPRIAPSRAPSIRAAEERVLRDRKEIGPRPVADPNAPEEAEYVSRYTEHERATTFAASGEASEHDGTPAGPQAIGGSDASDPSTPADGDRSERPPTFEEAPLRSTAYDVPGFGVDTALLALTIASLFAARRGDG